jgi:hypothetical protein
MIRDLAYSVTSQRCGCVCAASPCVWTAGSPMCLHDMTCSAPQTKLTYPLQCPDLCARLQSGCLAHVHTATYMHV